MSVERSEFYPKTIHILFAVVLATSFPLASETMIPIQVAFEPGNFVINTALALSYLVVILGWVGYARSTSFWRYKDTGLGFLRFVFDILILFEYFYLLQVAHAHVSHTPYVLLMLAVTYLASEAAKHYDQPRRRRGRIKRRMRSTISLFIWTMFIVYFFDSFGAWELAVLLLNLIIQVPPDVHFIITQLMGTIICVGLAFRHRAAKWKLQEGGGSRR